MKKVILSIAIIGAAFSTQAQKEDKLVNFGVKAGVNVANLSFSGDDGDENYDAKLGFHAGGFAEINLAKSFAIQPEILYSVLGAKADIEQSGIKIKDRQNISYISIPVLLKYKISGFGVYVGPQISILTSAKEKYEVGDDSSNESFKDDLKSSDFSAVAGAEYTLPLGLGFSARYQLGLSNIAKDGGDDYKVKNKALQVSVYYRF